MVVRGKRLEEMDAGSLAARLASHDGVTIDLGAGDGKWAYRRARAQPKRLFIALDPVRENLRETSAKAAKKPERGGTPNAIFAAASIEKIPAELRGLADEISVVLPWGSLMRGIVLGEPAVLGAIAAMGKPGALVRIVLNTRIFDDPVPAEVRDLPEVTPDYVRDRLEGAFARAGMPIAAARELSAGEVAEMDTTWAKRLSHRRPPRSIYIEATVEARPE